MNKSRLGKGLEALIPSGQETAEASPVAIEKIEKNPYQPREDFSEETLDELIKSIKAHGIIQPLIVRKKEDGKYQVVAGERRLKAAEKAGLSSVPAVIRDFSDREMMEVALIENLQRENLNPMEEAQAFHRLISEFGITQEEVSRVLGKSRSSIANTLRLLKLPPEVTEHVSRGTISMGHARALLALETKEQQKELARKIVQEGYNVRQTEKLVAGEKEKKKKRAEKKQVVNEEFKKWEKDIYQALGTKVAIRPRTSEKGTINIEYRSLEELKKIYSILGKDN